MEIKTIREIFHSTYGREASGIVRAPGRVNLIGEHTDYNEGFVLPIAIDRYTYGVYGLRDDSIVTFASAQADGRASIDLAGQIEPGAPPWSNYCRGVAAGLAKRGLITRGADILLTTDIPIGGGLGSSAALEIATAMALLAAANKKNGIEPGELALLCQKAEHEFAGVPVGIMDQSISLMGQRGRALLLDCRSGEGEQVPFDDPDIAVLVVDTQIKHDLASGEYALRREQCHSAAERLGVPTLRDLDEEAIAKGESDDALDRVQLMRVRHVVGEIARTLEGAQALRAGDYAKFGALMFESHASLRDDYRVSCEELDAIVDLAGGLEGVYGARLTGGGFGGCAIILAKAKKAKAASRAIRKDFARRFGHQCPVFTTCAAAGASVVQ